MQTDKQLRRQLKALKLSGLLETLDRRILECKQNQIDYRGFLKMLLQDELELRHQRKVKRLIKKAKFEQEQTLEDFDMSLSTGLNPTEIRELATCRFIERGEGIILTGPPGTGKTHLARALGHCACRKTLRVRFMSFNTFLHELKKAQVTERTARFTKRLIKQDLLIIDDFAFRKIDQWQSERLYEIVDRRYRVGSTILTSNRALSDWLGIFPDPVIGGAILDRLTHQSHQIQLKGESVRKKLGLRMFGREVDNPKK